MERLKVFCCFAGYDSQCLALDRLGIKYELVGWSEIDKLLNAGISNSQLYKLAGNSIVVDVLTAIFDKMFVHTEQSKGDQLTLF